MKKMKRTLSLVMAIVFALAPMTAIADDLCVEPCKVPGETLIYRNVQGIVDPIQFEGQRDGTNVLACPGSVNNSANSHANTSIRPGYIADHQSADARVVYRICDCPDQSTYFKVGEIVGIRMTIMTPGVFWTDESIAIQPFRAEADACSVTTEGLPNTAGDYAQFDALTADIVGNADGVYIGRTEIVNGSSIPHPGYLGGADGNADGVIDGTEATAGRLCWTAWDALYAPVNPSPDSVAADPFVPGAGLMTVIEGMPQYGTVPPAINGTIDYDYFLADGVTAANPIDMTTVPSSVIPAANQAQVVEVKGAYQIGLMEDYYNLSRWWIDIPEMRYDFSLVTPGSDVEIKIEWLNDSSTGVCGDCETICACTFVIGTFATSSVGATTITFPYVLSDTAPWFTGIAVANLGVADVSIAGMEAEVTMMDAAGDTFTYTKTDFDEAIWVFSVDSILDMLDGTPAPGAATLTIETNFPADGYQFLTDGTFGAGTLAR